MEYTCAQCKGQFNRYPSQVRNPERPFCSFRCKGDWQKMNLSGSANPNFGHKVAARKKSVRRPTRCVQVGIGAQSTTR